MGGLEAAIALHVPNDLPAFGVSAAVVDGLSFDDTAADAPWQPAVPGLSGRRLDTGEQVPLQGWVACCRDAVHGAEQHVGVPARQRMPVELPLQILVVGAGAAVEGEEQLEQEPYAVGGVAASGEGLAVPVILDGAVERVMDGQSAPAVRRCVAAMEGEGGS